MNTNVEKFDNVIEVLSKVLEFTERRGKVLNANVVNMGIDDYSPVDLDAVAFADIMSNALSEHLINNRLLMIDSDHIKFGTNGQFEAAEVADFRAKELFQSNPKKYLNYQFRKISENKSNRKVAEILIQQKKRSCSDLPN
jgi:flagellar basal body rod protein FlgB